MTQALLLRTGSSTHSIPYDARALWLEVAVGPTTAEVTLPASTKAAPPGM